MKSCFLCGTKYDEREWRYPTCPRCTAIIALYISQYGYPADGTDIQEYLGLIVEYAEQIVMDQEVFQNAIGLISQESVATFQSFLDILQKETPSNWKGKIQFKTKDNSVATGGGGAVAIGGDSVAIGGGGGASVAKKPIGKGKHCMICNAKLDWHLPACRKCGIVLSIMMQQSTTQVNDFIELIRKKPMMFLGSFAEQYANPFTRQDLNTFGRKILMSKRSEKELVKVVGAIQQIFNKRSIVDIFNAMMKNGGMGNASKLPHSVLNQIISSLPVRQIGRLARTSKTANQVVQPALSRKKQQTRQELLQRFHAIRQFEHNDNEDEYMQLLQGEDDLFDWYIANILRSRLFNLDELLEMTPPAMHCMEAVNNCGIFMDRIGKRLKLTHDDYMNIFWHFLEDFA